MSDKSLLVLFSEMIFISILFNSFIVFRCKICNIVCQGISKLEDHLNKHWGLKPFKCDVCNKSFISKHQVKLHKKTHNKEKNYKCSKCDKAFTNTGSLRSHQLVHAEKTTEVKCKVCNNVFQYRNLEITKIIKKPIEKSITINPLLLILCSGPFMLMSMLEDSFLSL